ncbi:putative serine esterase (DUF676) [Trypanosoma vivax]|nr:hypothetical protein TRVL_05587 [Trypanosoma vivax]KAH8611010.1 putative serine esterase (DUF676) [Trypanosoma vivax]
MNVALSGLQHKLHHFILLQHGLWAAPWDFDSIVNAVYRQNAVPLSTNSAEFGECDELSKNNLPPGVTFSKSVQGGRLFTRDDITCFAPGSNSLIRSHRSTVCCARESLKEFLPFFTEWLDMLRSKGGEGCFSCIGHSFGGIIIRELLYLLLVAPDVNGTETELTNFVKSTRQRLVESNIIFQNFITIASPHCGVAGCLPTPLYQTAWMLAMTCAPSIREILLKDSEALLSNRLIDEDHITALGMFRRRILFANTQKDFLVGFTTSSLLFEDHVENGVNTMEAAPNSAPCASAFENEDSAYSSVIHLENTRKSTPATSAQDPYVGVQQSCNEHEKGGLEGSASANQNTPAAHTHQTPRDIAARLRRELDWHLVALRYNKPIPAAHYSCLGWCPKSASEPGVVQRIAEEALMT